MNKLASFSIPLLLTVVATASAQPGFTPEERRAIEQVSQAVLDQCRREPLFEPSTNKDNASSFDMGRYCACQSNTLKAEVTPELIRRNSPREGAALRDSIQRACESMEFLASFARDCPAIVARTWDRDNNARKGTRLKNAGGTQNLCSCLVRRMRDKPVGELLEASHSSVAMIASARRTSTPISLDPLLEEGDLNACGWRLDAEAARVPAQPGKSAPDAVSNAVMGKSDLPVIGKIVDGAFTQWSTQWLWDRYIPDSVQITEDQAKNGVTLVRGTFRFARGPSVATIPFASTLQKQKSNWIVTNLCYNDTTSGMTDCANSGISAGARSFMGMAILGGLMAAISGYDASTSRGGDAAWREHDARRREREDDEARAAAHQREQERLDRDWSKMFEPSPLLPPPATIN